MKINEIEQVKAQIKVLEAKLSFLEDLEITKTPLERAYKEWFGQYPVITSDVDDTDDLRWKAFQAGYNQPKDYQWKYAAMRLGEMLGDVDPEWYYESTSDEWLEWATKKIQKQSEEPTDICDEEAPKNLNMIKVFTQDPPDFFKFQLGKTLEDLITEWWIDVFTNTKNINVDECIKNLVSMIEQWLPKEQTAEGSQNMYAVVAADAENQLLDKIKSKLYKKTDT